MRRAGTSRPPHIGVGAHGSDRPAGVAVVARDAVEALVGHQARRPELVVDLDGEGRTGCRVDRRNGAEVAISLERRPVSVQASLSAHQLGCPSAMSAGSAPAGTPGTGLLGGWVVGAGLRF